VLLTMTLLLVVAAGHLGGTLTHGEGYLTEHLLPLIGQPAGAEAGHRLPPRQAVIYTSLVQPVLDARCISCHGPNKAEGRLRLDSPEGLRAGGESGAAIAPGRPDDSDIVRRTWLPPSHEDAMPPDGHRPLTASEAALLRWWVEQGASFDQIVADAEMPAYVQPVVESVLGPIEPGAPAILAVRVPPAEPSAISALERLGARVKPIGSTTALLDVECSGAGAAFGDEQLQAIAAIAPQVTWLGLAGTAVTDGGLATVGTLPHLTRLRLERTRVTDAGLPHLAALQRLEYLNLYDTGVTDAGIESLEPLASLRHLYLWRTGVTVAGVERLRAALPRLTIDMGHSNNSNDSNNSSNSN
jgi:mono/diheme cytochrome c family protein